MLFPLRAQRPMLGRVASNPEPGGWRADANRLRRLRYLESLRSRLLERIDRINDAIALEVDTCDEPAHGFQEEADMSQVVRGSDGMILDDEPWTPCTGCTRSNRRAGPRRWWMR